MEIRTEDHGGLEEAIIYAVPRGGSTIDLLWRMILKTTPSIVKTMVNDMIKRRRLAWRLSGFDGVRRLHVLPRSQAPGEWKLPE